MELNAMKSNIKAIENGRWVANIPGADSLELKVRGLTNADYGKLQARLQDAVPRAKRPNGEIDEKEQSRIFGVCLAETVLLDWRNLTNNGKPVAYSKEKAKTILTDPAFADFKKAVMWAATEVSLERMADRENDEKNSPKPSTGR